MEGFSRPYRPKSPSPGKRPVLELKIQGLSKRAGDITQWRGMLSGYFLGGGIVHRKSEWLIPGRERRPVEFFRRGF